MDQTRLAEAGTPYAPPAIYAPQYLPEHQALAEHQVLAAADPRRALVMLESGAWVLATVPAAPPVIVQAAPVATARRPLSGLERTAITIVGSTCALILSAGGALAMAGPYLADVAELAFGAAALLGTAAAAWAVLRFTGALRRSSATAAAPGQAAAPTFTTNITNNVSSSGMFGRASQTTHIHQG